MQIVYLIIGALISASAVAQPAPSYPNRPIRMVAGMPAGGGADMNARRLAAQLNRILKQNIVVENIAGAAGNAAAVTVAGGNPDGHTIFFSSHPVFAVNPVLYEKLPFNPNDFQPVTLISQASHVLLATPSLPATKVSDLIALAKTKPRAINFGSGGPGTSLHLAGELLNYTAKIELVHIPYRGAAPAVVALISNEIQLLFDNSMTAIGHVRGGRVKALGIAAKARLVAIPEVPTLDESGAPGFEASISHGVLVLTAVPKPTVGVLNRAINTAISDPEYKTAMAELGVSLVGGTPEQFAKFLIAERAKYSELIRKQNIKAN
ncbi:MAG TPA: tripartite tricarboxylate transporter substrate-binding protein [Burkholderiales bacterium]|nr:tripartite tricarboxylate transporter substrate-binding protein [Burkholderiales bacterium]